MSDPNPVSSPNPSPGERSPGDAQWQRTVLENLAFASLKEQRSARRWKVFFRLLAFLYVGILIVYLMDLKILAVDKEMSIRHMALVNMNGVIDSEGDASAEKITSSLDSAFKDSGSAGVILKINSPGGSPVQAGMIYDEIKRLRAEYPAKPLYVVVEEMCASGGYYVAAASDKIYVDKAS